MKKLYLLVLVLLNILLTFNVSAQKSANGDIWLHMLTTGQPAATKFLGDQLNGSGSWFINFEVGQVSWNLTDAGIGLSNTDPSGWTWQTANWYENGGGSNKRVRSDFGSFKFTEVGNWYLNGRAKGDAGDAFHYANSDAWTNSGTFSPIYYFTVNALNNPSTLVASVNTANPGSSIDLSWSLNAQSHFVMIVRKKSTESWTEPTQGTAYSVGASIGSGIVVYKSNGTSYTNTGLNSSTGYDYKYYSENFSYYSSGIATSTVYTSSASTDYFRSKASGNWNSTGNWESSFDNINWANATHTPSSTSGTTTIKSAHTVSVNTSASVNGITIENGAFLSITSGNNLSVSGAFINNGTSSSMLIESGGSLITSGSVSGPATFKREIASDNKWHFISSPVSGQNICDGVFASTIANFNAATGPTYDFYKWSEPVVSGNLNWINLKNSDWTLNTAGFGTTPEFLSTTGYMVAYNSSFSGSTTKSFAGMLISGDQTVTLSTVGNTWNLIGNPFASSIDWDGIAKTNLDGGYYYVYNEAKAGGAGYESYLDGSHKTSGANGKISPAQGFFVKATGSSLVFPNSSRVHDNNWMKDGNSDPINQLTLKLLNGEKYDEAYLIFEPIGTSSRDYYDAFKMRSLDNSVPQVYTIADNDVELAINSMPFNTESFSIQSMIYIPSDGNYSFEVSGIESFVIAPGIILEDKKLGITQDMVVNPGYNFTASPNDDPARFILHFSGLTQIIQPETVNGILISCDNSMIKLVPSNEIKNGIIVVSDMAGRTVAISSLLQGKTNLISVNEIPGIYMVTVTSGTLRYSQKVLVK